MDTDDLAAEIAKITWYHTITLGDGIVTPGIDDTPGRLRKMGLPDDL